jgi:GMP synthase (glutamine-hydrolysing)
MRVWVLQHIHCETLGTIAAALDAKGIAPHYVRSFEGQTVPKDMDDALGLIIMGGPMGVYELDRYAFLRDEMLLIEQALKANKPILGVCLGSQLLASALGAEVKKGKSKEIGWYPVTLSEAGHSDPLWTGVDPSFMAYHWHGDIFDLPRGALSLASSALTRCQAYRYGANAYGFLFHMEVTADMIAAMVQTFRDELLEQGITGQSVVEPAKQHLPKLQEIGAAVFQAWANLASSPFREKA